MSDVEDKQAQQEALARSPGSLTTRKAQLWAGMMRYMAGEAVHQHEQAEKERAAESAEPEDVQP